MGAVLHRTGITANQLTAAGLTLAVAAAWAIGSGRLWLGLVLLVAAALPDLLDGPLAKAAGTASPRGAFFDSVADRATDALLLGGVAWYLASSRGAHAAVLAFAVLGASFLVSYERSKAEALGFQAKGGVMERAERIVVLGLGLLVPVILVPVLWVMLVLSLVTAAQRFVKVWRQASPDRQPPAEGPASRWTVAAMEARWRARREAAAVGPRRTERQRRSTRRRLGTERRYRARTRP